MEITDIIYRINERVPEAGQGGMYRTSLEVTEAGVREKAPEIIGDVKAAFLFVIQELNEDQFDQFLQNMIALKLHKERTVGLYAMPEMPDQSNYLSLPEVRKIEFFDDFRAWAARVDIS
jgi:hypothetical protein